MNTLKRITLYLRRLRWRWANFKSYDDQLKRRATVEAQLLAVVEGKRPPPAANECEAMAVQLGVPSEYRVTSPPLLVGYYDVFNDVGYIGDNAEERAKKAKDGGNTIYIITTGDTP